MKSYPSILRIKTPFDAYVFDKLDGTNIRSEWTKKKGWHKFGTRAGLIGEDHPQFGEAIPLFNSKYAEDLSKLFSDKRLDRVVCFLEFWGKESFAGFHPPEDKTRTVTLFDVSVHRQGMLGPKDFLDLVGHLDIARFIGQYRWNQEFTDLVWNGQIPCTYEGVVGKSGNGKSHDILMSKAKTKAWVERVRALNNPEEANLIIES